MLVRKVAKVKMLCSHLQKMAKKRDSIMLDDHGKSLHSHLVDESREVAQFLQGSFGEGQLALQISLMSHVEVNGLTALVGLFGMFHVQL